MIISQMVFSQSIPRMLEMADTLYKSHRYLDAIEFYDKITNIDKENYMARYRLGICYKETLQYEKAMDVLLKLGNIPGHNFRAKSLYYYANLLRLDSRFRDADSVYNYLIAVPDADPDLIELARKQREGCLVALRQQKVERGFKVNLFDEINSKFHDFGAILNPMNKHIVFASTRNLHEGQYEGNQYDGLLPDLVAYENRRGDRYRNATNDQDFGDLNTHWAEGSGSFTGDGKTFYFTTCHGEGGSDCMVMVSYLEGDQWTTPEPLNEYVNEPGFENKQPFVTKGGDTLFFCSNRPGGLGSSDIWMSLKGLEKESWTPAINMGAVINSPEEEISPYYSSAFNCLIFASDGHVGYGGYDLYLAKGKSFFEPEIYNLGYPFNSTVDDIYFNISDTVGFMASNRGDHHILDIYHFAVNDEPLFLSLLISGESLIHSRIVSRFRDIRSLDLVTFRVEDYQGFEFFEPIRREKPKPKLVREAKNLDSLRLLAEAKADSMRLVSQSLSSSEPQSLSQPSSGSLSNSSILGALSEDQRAFEHLYFGYGLHQLRPEAESALDDLIQQLNGQPFEKIMVLAYTDTIGNEKSNMSLSEKRGSSVYKYLVANGIPDEKIQVVARGEVNQPADHWFKRILNRRVEIIVQAEPAVNLNRAKPFIVRKAISLEGIADLFGLSLEDVRKWNGKQPPVLPPGSTIRIYEMAKKPTVKFFIAEEDLDMFASDLGG